MHNLLNLVQRIKNMNTAIPNHIAVILDGNRRWAVSRGLKPWEGHWKGEKVVEKFLRWCLNLGVPEISIYGMSTENIRRSGREIKELMKVFIHGLKNLSQNVLLEKYEVRV